MRLYLSFFFSSTVQDVLYSYNARKHYIDSIIDNMLGG